MSKKDKIDSLDTSEYHDKKLIAFDLYGTCLKLPEWIFHTWFSIPRDVRSFLKTNQIDLNQMESDRLIIEWVEIKLPKKVINKVKRDIAWTLVYPDFYSEIILGDEKYGDIIEYLKSKWYKTAVISNLSKPYEEPLRRLIKEWKFDYEALSFNVWEQKPNPKIFEHIKNKSGIDYNQMVLVWDSLQSDVLWANNVWIKPIYINRKHKHSPENIEKHWVNYKVNCVQISTLDQLVDIL